MKQLKSKLFELEMQKRNSEKQDLEDLKSDIGWGHQIRSYVLDQSRIKDLRTGVESSNTQDVLDGNLTDLIIVSGNVNDHVQGDYVIGYSVSDKAGNPSRVRERIVRIRDTLPPVLSLFGGREITIEPGALWIEPGVGAFDLAGSASVVAVSSAAAGRGGRGALAARSTAGPSTPRAPLPHVKAAPSVVSATAA